MNLAENVLKTTGALIAARVIVVVAGIGAVALASRYLGLAEYGALTTAMAFAATFTVLTDLGVSTVAIREIARNPEEERDVLGAVLVAGAVAGVFAALLAVGAMFVAYPGAENLEVRQGIAILLVQLVVAPVVGVARAHYTAVQRGWWLALGEVGLAVAMVAATAVVVIADWGFIAAVVAVASGYAVQALVMGALVVRDRVLVFRARRETVWRLLKLALPIAGMLVANYLYFRLDLLLLSWLKDDEAVGLYGLAYRVIEALMIVPSYLMLALFPEIARGTENRERLSQLITPALGAMAALALPVVALTAIFADQIVLIIGSEEFADAAPALRILMLALGISYLNGVYGNALVAVGRQKWLFWLTLLVLGANIALNLVLIPPYGVEGAAWAVVLTELLAYLVVRNLYVRAAGKPGRPRHLRIALAALGLLPAAAMALAFDDALDPLLLAVAGGAVGLLGYGALLIHFDAVPELRAVRSMIASRRRPSSSS